MNHRYLASLGLTVLLSTAACHKAAPVAATHPPDTTPVAPAERPAPPPQQRTPTPAPPPQQARQEAPRPAQMTPQERQTLNEKLARLEDALFDYDKSTIREDARTALAADVGVIRDILANYPSQKLLIEGHCDERGSEEYNMALGDRRARAAEEFLNSMGISATQLTIISMGKDKPVCTDASEGCWQKNRRAHVTAAP
jgi:peptidoglycan-associated lipoprotein